MKAQVQALEQFLPKGCSFVVYTQTPVVGYGSTVNAQVSTMKLHGAFGVGFKDLEEL